MGRDERASFARLELVKVDAEHPGLDKDRTRHNRVFALLAGEDWTPLQPTGLSLCVPTQPNDG